VTVRGLVYGPGSLCRTDGDLSRAVTENGETRRLVAGACATIVVGSAAYGFAFGFWRCPMQGVYSAVKMPVLFFLTAGASGLINTMLAQLLGARLTLKQVCTAMLVGMGIATAIMGSLSPVALFIIAQMPGPDPAAVGRSWGDPVVMESMAMFWRILLMHVSLIGAACVIGNLRLYQLLKRLTGDARLSVRVLATWLCISGFVGCELSWLLSPFLCKPNFPAHFITRTYFQGNFYEQIWRALWRLL